MLMKTIVYRSMAAVLLCVFALGVAAQGVLKVKVTNIPSAVGIYDGDNLVAGLVPVERNGQ